MLNVMKAQTTTTIPQKSKFTNQHKESVARPKWKELKSRFIITKKYQKTEQQKRNQCVVEKKCYSVTVMWTNQKLKQSPCYKLFYTSPNSLFSVVSGVSAS